MRNCATRSRNGAKRSTGRSARIDCATTSVWTNNYYDDMAWLALALERAARLVGLERRRALPKLADQFVKAWVPEDGGGIPWRKQDQFFNAPANGPAGIFLARYGDRLKRAEQMGDWIDRTLIDSQTHLVFDGIKAGSLVRAQYTYCQGVVLGLETELAARTGAEARSRHAARVHRLVAAVDEHMAPSGVLQGGGGGDGGLFAGVTARYLALVATTPGGVAGGARRRRRRPRYRSQDRVVQREIGVGLPANRRRAARIRGVLGSRRRAAHERRGRGTVRRGHGGQLRGRRTGPLGAAVGLDADGGGVQRHRRPVSYSGNSTGSGFFSGVRLRDRYARHAAVSAGNNDTNRMPRMIFSRFWCTNGMVPRK